MWRCVACFPVGDDGEPPDDASFQSDPEYYQFSCLSSEEAWNYLDSQAREASRAIKVGM